jgi:hypothetical protein
MGDVEAHPLHRLEHRRRRRGGRGHHGDPVGDPALAEIAQHLRGRVEQHVHHDRRAAEMGHAVIGDRRVDGAGLDPAEADMGAGERRHRPGEAPAVAVEHRQRPEIDGIPGHAPDERIADGVQIGAAVMI